MKKNLFDEAVKNEIINRSLKLTDVQQPKWGKMNAPEMLRHCSEAIKSTLTQPTHFKPSSLKQILGRYAMLYLIPRYPHGAKTPRKLDMKINNVTGLTLTGEKKYFAERINLFYRYDKNITTNHSYFGNMNRKQWGIITWMHMDHHLRQFGV